MGIYEDFRLPRQYAIAVLAILALCVFSPVARATSYNYQLSATVYGETTYGTITGTFTIDTDGVPYDTVGGYENREPLLTASSLFWNPVGGAPIPFGTSNDILPSAGGDSSNSQAETCSFAPNTECSFLVFGGAAIGPAGSFDITGYMGQQLNINDVDYGSLITVYGPNGAVISSDLQTRITGTALPTPEPPSLSLIIIGGIFLALPLVKRRSGGSASD